MDSDHCLVEATKSYLDDTLEHLELKNELLNTEKDKIKKKMIIQCEVFAESLNKDDLKIESATVDLTDEKAENFLKNINLIDPNQLIEFNQNEDLLKTIIGKNNFIRNKKNKKEEEDKQNLNNTLKAVNK